MRFLTFLLFVLFSSTIAWTQSGVKYSRAKIHFEKETLLQLAELGLDLDHGDHHHAKDPDHHDDSYIISDFADYELEQARNAGFEVEILIEDVQGHYVDQNINASTEIVQPSADSRNPENCEASSVYDIPQNFTLGSMGGYYTYEEMLAIFDDMANQYPDLISQKAPINASLTHEGRPIYWLKISDNPNVDEDEPEVFYNSLTHAREPNSLTQNIYYMWYLLENYAVNDEVKYLVDHTEMYFVPCVNPDGYVFNQTTNPNGGGLWRKNRRDNGDGTFGVDINRNYGYEWGHDDFGSSGNTNSQVYRGTAPFSEPETQMIREFCNAHEFVIALNCHTYSNLLLYPFSYSDSNAEPETFVPLGEVMTRASDYEPGWGTAVLGYAVNGDAVDWQYGEQTEKPKIYPFIPEVGPVDYGFWPPQDEIVRVTQTALEQNIYAVHLVQLYAELEETGPAVVTQTDNDISFSLSRLGLRDGTLTVGLEAMTSNVVDVSAPIDFNLSRFGVVSSMIGYTLDSDIQDGEEFTIKITWSNGLYTWSKTVTKYFGMEEELVNDMLSSQSGWMTIPVSGWGVTGNTFLSAPFSMTDSPNGFYNPSTTSYAELDQTIDLTEADAALIKFGAKWELETARDYVQVEVRKESEADYTPLCGKYTKSGSPFQEPGEPLFDGYQRDWVFEEMDLSDYLGEQIRVRFKFQSNPGFFVDDGFYFDNFEITKVEADEVLSTGFIEGDQFTIQQNRPNPSNDFTIISVDGESQLGNKLVVYNILGQQVMEQEFPSGKDQSLRINTKNWEEGVYFYQIMEGNLATKSLKMTVQH